MQKLLTNKETAELLGVSLASFYRIARKHIPARVLGPRTVRFDQRDVEAFANSKSEDRGDA
jgi:excisionase family DNA binding protein